MWLVLRLVPLMGSGRDRTLRSQPRALHARLALTRDEEVGHLLIARSVPSEWIDLLDMLQVEGGIIPRASAPGREDPIDGTAHRLAISCVWPLDTRHSTALLSAHIVIAAEPSALEHWQPLDPMLVPSDHLSALGERFVDITPAAVYHAALGASAAPASTPAPLAPTISVGSVAAVGASPSPLTTPPAAPSEPTAAASLGTISAKFSSRRLRAALRAMQAEVERLHPIHAFDPTPAQTDALEKLQQTPIQPPPLLCGEVGTGKALIARLLHKNLELSGPFLRLPAHELPEAVMPIELFGDEETPGLVEAAKGGLLLIEGADRIPGHLFLRLLDASLAPAAPRLLLTLDLPASCVDPLAKFDEEVAKHLEHIIRLAPLREQPDAIESLAFAFLHRASMRHGRVIIDIASDALDALKQHAWTSNIQEMKHALDAAVVRCRGDVLGIPDLALSGLHTSAEPTADSQTDPAGIPVSASQSGPQTTPHTSPHTPPDAPTSPPATPSPASLDRTLDDLFSSSYEEIERRLISAAMRASQGSKSKAARMLNMRRDILSAKLNKMSPQPPTSKEPPL